MFDAFIFPEDVAQPDSVDSVTQNVKDCNAACVLILEGGKSMAEYDIPLISLRTTDCFTGLILYLCRYAVAEHQHEAVDESGCRVQATGILGPMQGISKFNSSSSRDGMYRVQGRGAAAIDDNQCLSMERAVPTCNVVHRREPWLFKHVGVW